MLADATFIGWLSKLNNGILVMGILAIAGTVISVGIAWACAWLAARKSEHRTRLAAMMVDRRIPHDDIQRILDATSGPLDEASASPRSAKDSEVWLVKRLTDASYSGADADRILAAARHEGEIDPSTAAIISTLAENWADTDDIVKLLEGRRRRFATGDGGSPNSVSRAGVSADALTRAAC